MTTSKRSSKVSINYDHLVGRLREALQSIPDHRGPNIVHQLADVLMSAYAMFALKYPSLLSFEQQTKVEKENLKQLFGIEKICSDAQMRRILDELSPSQIDQLFAVFFRKMRRLSILNSYRFLNKYYLCSIDAVRYFESRKVNCEQCQHIKHQNGESSYHHAMLGAVLVHPDRRDVFPLMSEAMKRQKGQTKNDSELEASKRLHASILEHYGKLSLVIVEDALYANEPHLNHLLSLGYNFIVGVRPTKNVALFRQLEGRQKRGDAKQLVIKRGQVIHYFYWTNNIPLNNRGNLRVNFLNYEQHYKGKVKKFSWVTSLTIREGNVEQIMLGGRARWKIENETFNTLKNQGYHFEHNYGHGKKYLCDVLGKIMLLAFLIDQIIQAANRHFNQIWVAAKAKKRVWEKIRAIYMTQAIQSFKELFIKMANIFEVKLE